MSRTLRVIVGLFLLLGGLSWLVDGFRLIFDSGYTPDKLSIIIAFFATGILVLDWVVKIARDEE